MGQLYDALTLTYLLKHLLSEITNRIYYISLLISFYIEFIYVANFLRIKILRTVKHSERHIGNISALQRRTMQ